MHSAVSPAWPPAASFPDRQDLAFPGGGFARKKLAWAFVRWLLLGSHYLYLRRPFTQAIFWATFGGLLLWWLIDLSRLGHLVRQHNQRALQRLVDEHHDLLEQRVRSQAPQFPIPEVRPFVEPSAPPPQVPPGATPTITGFETRPGAILLLSCAFATAIALYIFSPPPLSPERAALQSEGSAAR